MLDTYYDNALPYLQEAAKLLPKSFAAQKAVADCYYNLFKDDEAFASYELAVSLYSQSRAAGEAAGRSVAIMADLSGPKMRIGNLREEKILLKEGERFTLTTEEHVGDRQRVSERRQGRSKYGAKKA